MRCAVMVAVGRSIDDRIPLSSANLPSQDLLTQQLLGKVPPQVWLDRANPPPMQEVY